MRKQTAISLLAALVSVCVSLSALPLTVSAETLIVNSSTLKKAATSNTPKPSDGNTKVINVKGSKFTIKPQSSKTLRALMLKESVCKAEMKGFYCGHVGREAAHTGSGEVVGRIVGVVWRKRGDAVGPLRLEGGAETAGEKNSEKDFEKNQVATRDGFYYLIEPEPEADLYLLECERAIPR